ncbi:MAG: pitrilysin family protein [Polyangia bacterium]
MPAPTRPYAPEPATGTAGIKLAGRAALVLVAAAAALGAGCHAASRTSQPGSLGPTATSSSALGRAADRGIGLPSPGPRTEARGERGAASGRDEAEARGPGAARDAERLPLPGGGLLVLQPDHIVHTVAVQAWLRAGAADEAAEQLGVAHLVERLLLYEQAREPLTRLRASGGEVASWTTQDQTVFHALAASERAPQALELIAAVLGAVYGGEPRFDAAGLERQRRIVLAELREQGSSPQALRALFEAAFPSHPYSRPLLGTAETLRRLDRGAALGFLRARYRPENLVLVVTGDFDAAAVRAQLRTLLPAGAGGAPDALARTGERVGARPGPPPRPEPDGPRVRLEPYDRLDGEPGRSQVLLGIAGSAAGTREAAALDLLAVLLGYGEGSRLGRALGRSARLDGVAEPLAWNFTGRDAGLLLVGATLPATASASSSASSPSSPGAPGTGPAALFEEAARLLIAEVQGIAASARGKEIGAAELARAQRLLLADAAYLKQTPAGRARRLGFFASLGVDEHAYQHELAQLTPGALQVVLARALRADRVTLLLSRPRGEARVREDDELRRRLVAQLAVLGPGGASGPPAGAVAGGGAGAHPSPLEPVRTAAGLVQYQLSSGARLLVLPDPGVELVALVGLWPGGLRLEDERTAGAHQLLTRVWPRAPRLRTAEAMARELEGLTASLQPVLDRDSFGLRAELPSASLDAGLQLFLDCLQQPVFSDLEIERERRVLAQELRGPGAAPPMLAAPDDVEPGPGPRDEAAAAPLQLVREALFGRHPYRLEATPQSLAAVSRRRLIELYRRAYPLSRLVLVAVGDVDPAALAERIEARLGPPPAGQTPTTATTTTVPSPATAGPGPGEPAALQKILRYGPGQQAHLVLGFQAPGLRDPARYSVEVLFEILVGRGGATEPRTGERAETDGRGARLGRLGYEIQGRRGLAFALQGVLQLGVDPGLLGFYLSASPTASDAAYAALRDELHRLMDRPVADAELRLAQESLLSRFALRHQRRIDRALGLAQDAALGLKGRSEDGYPAGVLAVRAADVQAAARRYLDEQRAVLAAVLPESQRPVGHGRVQLALRAAEAPLPSASKPATERATRESAPSHKPALVGKPSGRAASKPAPKAVAKPAPKHAAPAATTSKKSRR